jgi:hypothetical protein
MIRALPVCAALLALIPIDRAEAGPEPTETVIRLAVRPAAEPRPALRYQLLPELPEMNPGNPLPTYMKCFAEQNYFWFDKQAVANREKWRTMPLKDLPREELAQAGYGKGQNPLAYADEAARLQSMDWQALLPLRKHGLDLLVPEIQPLRNLAGALQVRLRLEIAEGRYDDAVATSKTMLALGRHLGEHPTLIGNLVGVAVVSLTLESLGEMVGQPGSPNLYWALATLPHPLVDLRNGLQGERVFLAGELRAIDAHAPMTEMQIQKVLKRAQELSGLATEKKEPPRDVAAIIAARAGDAADVAAARKRLREYGVAAAAIKQLPAVQVILLDEKFMCESRRDTAQALLSLPYWQVEKALMAASPFKEDRGKTLYADLIPAYLHVGRAQARIAQRIALLRCVEGLRLYAAAHDGKLPAKLADVSVPLPVDPVTGRAFVYELQGGTAVVRGTPPQGLEKNPAANVRYEITIAQ